MEAQTVVSYVTWAKGQRQNSRSGWEIQIMMWETDKTLSTGAFSK